MAGYEEENQYPVTGYEEEEEEDPEEFEEVEEEVEEDEEEEAAEEEQAAAPEGARGGGGGGGGEEAGGYGDAGGEEAGERAVTAEPADGSGKVFVGGVAWETTEEKFAKHFQKYGAITDSVIMKDKHTRMPRGFGFITFSDPSVIDRVLEDEHTIDGRTVEVKRTVPREEMSTKEGPKTRKIFVGGIPPSLTEGKLKEYFSSYGNVAEHQIMVDHSTGRSRGFGFVTFESEDAVERVMSGGRMHELGGKQVEIKRAEPKKPGGGDSSSNGRYSHGGGGHRSSYRGGGGGGGGGGGRSVSSSSSGSGYGYGADYRAAAAAYYGSAGYGGYGRGYGAYGSNPAFGSGFGSGYGGSIYGAGPYGAYGAYAGAYGGGAYGAPGGYGATGGYGPYGGAGSMGGGSASGRGSGRYHPYGK